MKDKIYYPEDSITPRHKCRKPLTDRERALWRCPECNTWWFSANVSVFGGRGGLVDVDWLKVRFWNLRLKNRIKIILSEEAKDRGI